MKQQLFRKKNIDRMSSPERLNEYIRVTNPGVWLVCVAIVIFLIGVCVWGIWGYLDTTLSTVAIAENGEVTVYVKEADITSVKKGMTVMIGESECEITDISVQPVAVDSAFTDYALYVGGLQNGEWVYAVKISGTFVDGVHSAKIVIESVSPISFIFKLR